MGDVGKVSTTGKPSNYPQLPAFEVEMEARLK
jgi:hypothetical protein